MGITEIYKIWRQIVIDSPHRSEGQLNSFAVIDNLNQLNSATTEMSFNDYKAGWFWSRKTENKGAQAKILMEYDLLYLETVKSSNMTSPFSVETCHDLFVSVASPAECTDCKRTVPEIDDRNLFNLRTAIKEFFTYGMYTVSYDTMGFLDGEPLGFFDGDEWQYLNGGNDADLWMSEGRAAYLNSIDGFTVKGPKRVMTSYVNPGPLEIFQGGKYVDNLRVKTVQLVICDCYSEDQSFKYEEPTTKKLLMLKCDSC